MDRPPRQPPPPSYRPNVLSKSESGGTGNVSFRDPEQGDRDIPTLSSRYSANDDAVVEEGAAFGESSSNMRRKKSLVRPDRERIDPNHRQYYYRNHAAQMEEQGTGRIGVMPSTTGNYPIASLRRGKSILNRDQDVQESGLSIFKRSATLRRNRASTHSEQAGQSTSQPVPHSPSKARSCWFGNTPGPHDPWMLYSWILTCWIPPFALSTFGIRSPEQQRAWREKIGLVFIILILMTAVGFLTFGFQQTVCGKPPQRLQTGKIDKSYLIIHGYAYELSKWKHPAVSGSFTGNSNPLFEGYNAGGMDASFLFQRVNQRCSDFISLPQGSSITTNSQGGLNWYFPCNLYDQFGTTGVNISSYDNARMCHTKATSRNQLNALPRSAEVYYTWDDVKNSNRNLAVYESSILDLSLLNWLRPAQVTYPTFFDELKAKNGTYNGKDITMHFYRTKQKALGACLQDILTVGFIDTKTFGCVASDVVLYVSLVFIIGVVAIKFGMAVLFGWFLSWKLGSFGDETYQQRMERARAIEAWTDNIHSAAPRRYRPDAKDSYKADNRKSQFFPTKSRFSRADMLKSPVGGARTTTMYGAPDPAFKRATVGGGVSPAGFSSRSSTSLHGGDSDPSFSACPWPLKNVIPQPPPDYEPNNFPLAHTICLVTAYSESVEGLRTTLDSLATTDYANSHKLIMVIADGMVKGSGNSLTTPEIVLSMMQELVIPIDEVEAHSYVAIADGHKRHNMAKVYAGFYLYDDATVERSKQQRVPIVLVAKCGNPLEGNDPKPGNRGKRDSQIVLMSFLQKVMFDERMTTFEYEFFNSIWRVTGISPDKYEIVLCVDADTKIFPDSLTRMVACMVNDEEIMGLCGETKIANKAETWVTMIQVFEYYISHHLTKAFESMFGGVTCLPGCFSMYRIKAPKGGSGFWVPILANPDIVEHYSENIVDTLHKKNLLLLGEDRYLTTLMLKTFPKRKMIFCPQAVCKTIVPDTFSVLLSQRRRWINSTIHNLAELLLVRDLCGTFCFSMQFVVFMELAGTLVLPAAISFTIYLIVISIIPGNETPTIPLILLGIILGLPGLLIVVTSRKVAYVGWMLVYLFSLPIWNFVLPTYAFWHFDDFSWGQTRMVAGEKAGGHHGDKEGEFDSSHIIMKRWAEFERDRRFKSGMHSRDSTYLDNVRSGSPKRPESNRYSVVSTAETQMSDAFLGRPQLPYSQSPTYDSRSDETHHPISATSRARGELMLPAPLAVGLQRRAGREESPVSAQSQTYLSPGAISNGYEENGHGDEHSSRRLIPSPGDVNQPSVSNQSSDSTIWVDQEGADHDGHQLRYNATSPPPPPGAARPSVPSAAYMGGGETSPYRSPAGYGYPYEAGSGGGFFSGSRDHSEEDAMMTPTSPASPAFANGRSSSRGVSLVDNGPIPDGAGRRVPRPSARRASAVPPTAPSPQPPASPSTEGWENRTRSRPPGAASPSFSPGGGGQGYANYPRYS
ncbi:Chitin synthase, class 3 [Tulasnella sp. 418]|nr:Chitin synthase, class 3 [Tulasnella sp. 418]